VKVVWTETAVAHLIAIHEHIARTSPVYAQLMVRRLWDRAGKLLPFPNTGRLVPEVGTDVREVLESPYRVIYRVGPDRIAILAVIHVRRGPRALEDAEPGRAT